MRLFRVIFAINVNNCESFPTMRRHSSGDFADMHSGVPLMGVEFSEHKLQIGGQRPAARNRVGDVARHFAPR